MSILDFFSSSNLQLPLKHESEDFAGFLRDKFDAFYQEIDRRQAEHTLLASAYAEINQIRQLGNGILETISQYSLGWTFGAYNTLADTLGRIKTRLEILDSSAMGARVRTNRFYRARVTDPIAFTRRDLFHIPANLRHKVATQRFSIQGLPCLYLGGSTYTCWRELGGPDFGDLTFSGLWFNKPDDFRFLDLRHRPAWFAEWFRRNGNIPLDTKAFEYILTHIVCWPLFAACLTKARFRGSYFTNEYMIPYMVLSWILEGETPYSAVAYPSTHIDFPTEDPHWTSNYVLPVRDLNKSKYCSILTTMLRITEPYSVRLLEATSTDNMPSGAVDQFEIEIIEGQPESYYKTDFGDVQAKLNRIILADQARIANGNTNLGRIVN